MTARRVLAVGKITSGRVTVTTTGRDGKPVTVTAAEVAAIEAALKRANERKETA